MLQEELLVNRQLEDEAKEPLLFHLERERSSFFHAIKNDFKPKMTCLILKLD